MTTGLKKISFMSTKTEKVFMFRYWYTVYYRYVLKKRFLYL